VQFQQKILQPVARHGKQYASLPSCGLRFICVSLVTIGSSVLALELFEMLNAAATIKFQLSAFCVTLGIHLRLH
jgi:hypothetical protein